MEKERELLKRAQKLAYNQDDLSSSDDEELVEVDGEFQVVSKKKNDLDLELEKKLNDSIKSTTITNTTNSKDNNIVPSETAPKEQDQPEPSDETEKKPLLSEKPLNELAMVAKSKEIIALISARIMDQVQATTGTARESTKGATESEESKPGSVSCEIEINDYPQYARWKVTNRDSINSIYDVSRAAITVRGTYIPPNQRITDPNARKLHLFVEAESDMALERAKIEIKRIIKEATFEAASRGLLEPVNRGKYSV